MREFIDKFWHSILSRPYGLSKQLDQGSGVPVVLLHGIGRTGRVWQHVVEYLAALPVRVVAFDLLGFGASPKPAWSAYDIDSHAKAVIASISRLRFGQPVIIVGHSMGSLVAVRVARLRPDLVRHLVLYEMPLYEGLPQKRIYRLRTDLYFRIYTRITRYKPNFTAEKARFVDKLARRITGLEVTAETWQPFVRSLQNTIMKQTAADDIRHIKVPMDVIYGTRDMLVIRGEPRKFFGDDSTHITGHTVKARHEISAKSSSFIVTRIEAAIQNKAVSDTPNMLR